MSGSTLRTDGRVALVMDVARLLRSAPPATERTSRSRARRSKPPRKHEGARGTGLKEGHRNGTAHKIVPAGAGVVSGRGRGGGRGHGTGAHAARRRVVCGPQLHRRGAGLAPRPFAHAAAEADGHGAAAAGQGRPGAAVAAGEPARRTGALAQAFSEFVDEFSQVLATCARPPGRWWRPPPRSPLPPRRLSQGTTEQATSVQEITANLEQMNAIIRQNAAEQRRDPGDRAQGCARGGGERPGRSRRPCRPCTDRRRSASSRRSPARPTCWRSTPPSRRPAPASTARGSPSWPARCASCRSAARRRPRTSAGWPRPSVRIAEQSGTLLDELIPSIKKTAELVEEVAAGSNEQATGVAADEPGHGPGRSGDRTQRRLRRAAGLDRRGDDRPGPRPARAGLRAADPAGPGANSAEAANGAGRPAPSGTNAVDGRRPAAARPTTTLSDGEQRLVSIRFASM